MKKEALVTQQLKEQGFPSVGGIRRMDTAPQLIPTRDNWIRGKAHIEGDYVYLDAESCEEYYPERADRLVLLDFLNLDLHDQGDVTEFVGQYGLLSYTGLEVGCEDLEFWAETHLNISNVIQLHIDIQRANRDESRAFNELATIADDRYVQSLKALENRLHLSSEEVDFHQNIKERHESEMFGNKNTTAFSDSQKRELLIVANLNLALKLSRFMKEIAVGTSFRPLSLPQQNKESPKCSLVLDYRAPDLYGYLWLQVGFWTVDGKTLGKCVCGQYYPMTRSNRKGCKDGCHSNLRVRRKRERDKMVTV